MVWMEGEGSWVRGGMGTNEGERGVLPRGDWGKAAIGKSDSGRG
jgi:hypothetical protein